MISAIADTHTTLWFLASDPRLGKAAQQFIDDVSARNGRIGVSAITFAEIVYLAEKNRIPPTALERLQRIVADPDSVFETVEVDEGVAVAMQHISREEVPDLPDRLIAATSRVYGVPLLTCDRRIRATTIPTIW